MFWRWKSRRRAGRPRIDRGLRELIRRISRENPLWGASRIHGELLMLGFEVAQSTVSKYLVRSNRPPSQTWKTFLRNHADAIAAIDMVVVPTVSFDRLFAFLVVGHGRRELSLDRGDSVRRQPGWPNRLRKPSLGHRRRLIWCATMTAVMGPCSHPGLERWGYATGRSRLDRPGRTGSRNDLSAPCVASVWITCWSSARHTCAASCRPTRPITTERART